MISRLVTLRPATSKVDLCCRSRPPGSHSMTARPAMSIRGRCNVLPSIFQVPTSRSAPPAPLGPGADFRDAGAFLDRFRLAAMRGPFGGGDYRWWLSALSGTAMVPCDFHCNPPGVRDPPVRSRAWSAARATTGELRAHVSMASAPQYGVGRRPCLRRIRRSIDNQGIHHPAAWRPHGAHRRVPRLRLRRV